MSNPFLKAKQAAGSQTSSGQSTPGYIGNPILSQTAAPPQMMSYPQGGQFGSSAPPPPPVFGGSLSPTPNYVQSPTTPPPPPQGQQMYGASMGPPPAKSQGVSGSNAAIPKGRYAVPQGAYDYGAAAVVSSPPTASYSSQQAVPGYSPMAAEMSSTYAYSSSMSSMSAPPPIDPASQPDEEYARLSLGVAPNSSSLETLSGITFGAVFRPLAATGSEIPVVSFGGLGVQRCKRCRAYTNPFIQFLNNGRSWKCNMCSYTDDVHPSLYCATDSNGKRSDLQSRPELLRGQVEFEAGPDYCLRSPMNPCFLFLIDVSYQSVTSGMLSTVCTAIKNSIDSMIANLKNNTINVGLITFDSSVHFYRLSHDKAPKIMVVSEVDDIYMPVPSSLLINICEEKDAFVDLLDKLPDLYANTRAVDTCTGSVLSFALLLIQDIGGKVLLFQSSVPSLGAGKLKQREAANMLGTEAEKELLQPANDLYTKLGKEMVEKQITVDTFLCPPQYTDVSSISPLSKCTGGQLFRYPGLTPTNSMAEALYSDVCHCLTREHGWEAVFRVRVPSGSSVSAFYGSFTVSNNDLIGMPVCNADSTVTVEFTVPQTALNVPCFPIQGALLYTNSSAMRRIRVFTLNLPVGTALSHLYERANQHVLAQIAMCQAVSNVSLIGPSLTRQKLHQACVSIIKKTLVGRTAGVGAGASAIPETLSLIPLYMMSLQKNRAFRGGMDVKSDDRAYYMNQLMFAGVDDLKRTLYPCLMVITDLPPQACTYLEDTSSYPDTPTYGPNNLILPPQINLSLSSMNDQSIYLLDDGFVFMMAVGSSVNPEELQQLFGVPSIDGIDLSQMRLPILDTPLNQAIHVLMNELRLNRPYFCPLSIMRVSDPMFAQFRWRLIEDKDLFQGSNCSYGEYMGLVTGGISTPMQ